jgi:hypothetical protein
MKSIYLLDVFYSFDGVEYAYRFSRIYSSSREMKENIENWAKSHKYAISSKKDEELIYKTEIGSFYKIRISKPIVNSSIF